VAEATDPVVAAATAVSKTAGNFNRNRPYRITPARGGARFALDAAPFGSVRPGLSRQLNNITARYVAILVYASLNAP